MYHQWSRNGCMYTYMIKQEAESRTKLVPYFCSDDTPPFFSLTRAIIQFERETNFCFVWFYITSKQTCDAGLLGCSTHQFWLYVLFPDQTTVGKAANKWQAHTKTFHSQPMINKLLKKKHWTLPEIKHGHLSSNPLMSDHQPKVWPLFQCLFAK